MNQEKETHKSMQVDRAETEPTPYERFLRNKLAEEKAKLDSLNQKMSKANPLSKMVLKRQIAQISTNIDLLSNDLKKYDSGLSWLREPSKERDEKAEHLKPVSLEELQAAQPRAPLPAASQAKGPTPTPAKQPQPGPVPAGRPRIGTPVGTQSPAAMRVQQSSTPQQTNPSPSVRQEAASQTPGQKPQPAQARRPTIGTPIGAQRPTIGTPIGRPRIGTPVGTSQNSETQKAEEEDQKIKESTDAANPEGSPKPAEVKKKEDEPASG